MSNLVKHAEAELARINNDGAFDECIVRAIKAFAAYGHSGGSASSGIETLYKLLNYEPLTPLTGDDSEWQEPVIADEPLLQNLRCSRVFKRTSDGVCFDVEGYVVIRDMEEESNIWHSSEAKIVTFPYMPSSEYVTAKEFLTKPDSYIRQPLTDANVAE